MLDHVINEPESFSGFDFGLVRSHLSIEACHDLQTVQAEALIGPSCLSKAVSPADPGVLAKVLEQCAVFLLRIKVADLEMVWLECVLPCCYCLLVIA